METIAKQDLASLRELVASVQEVVKDAPPGAELMFSVLGMLIVASACAGTVKQTERAQSSGGKPSSVCPECGRGASAPCKPWCGWRK